MARRSKARNHVYLARQALLAGDRDRALWELMSAVENFARAQPPASGDPPTDPCAPWLRVALSDAKAEIATWPPSLRPDSPPSPVPAPESAPETER